MAQAGRAQMDALPDDYYDLLEIPRGTEDQDKIKRAYRIQARKWHPDKNAGAGRECAEERFKRIAEAFEVLSDPQKKAAFDAGGDAFRLLRHGPRNRTRGRAGCP